MKEVVRVVGPDEDPTHFIPMEVPESTSLHLEFTVDVPLPIEERQRGRVRVRVPEISAAMARQAADVMDDDPVRGQTLRVHASLFVQDVVVEFDETWGVFGRSLADNDAQDFWAIRRADDDPF